MDLDPRLSWHPRWQYDTHATALHLDGVIVAMLLDRVDGDWFARLECQKLRIDEPLVTRRCSSFEAGRRGCEVWAMRHLDRLLTEVAEVKARRPKHCGAGQAMHE
ncbi:hypothetical protein [Stenotrophomonas sp. MMGLT7]|uniref:hypothetical protein n=1 Tax=Stenotrophomonas sp. MMGLT7 TaxID=2901227 RepID=UPI001E415802|nr:hypothetical protein [Stenotrophomonas sp. MMGLT7]MCD7096924.1 hypothetical protein [Stenotrophomonas sp. MMGLT7]